VHVLNDPTLGCIQIKAQIVDHVRWLRNLEKHTDPMLVFKHIGFDVSPNTKYNENKVGSKYEPKENSNDTLRQIAGLDRLLQYLVSLEPRPTTLMNSV